MRKRAAPPQEAVGNSLSWKVVTPNHMEPYCQCNGKQKVSDAEALQYAHVYDRTLCSVLAKSSMSGDPPECPCLASKKDSPYSILNVFANVRMVVAMSRRRRLVIIKPVLLFQDLSHNRMRRGAIIMPFCICKRNTRRPFVFRGNVSLRALSSFKAEKR